MFSWIDKTRQLGTQLFSLLQRALPIDAPKHPACVPRRCGGKPKKKSGEQKFGNYARSKFWPRCLMAQGALLRQYIGAGIPICRFKFLNKIQNGGEQFAVFCLFMGTSPKKYGLLGGNGNTLKLKTTAKLKDKRTSIATVRGLYRKYATFPTPLGTHYRLPLMLITYSTSINFNFKNNNSYSCLCLL